MKVQVLFAAALLLAGCSAAGTESAQPEQEETVVVETYTVKENDSYFAPEAPTKAIAQAYDALTAALGTDEEGEKAAVYFLTDFFTLSNKTDESDIGALDLIPSSSADVFTDYAKYYYYNAYPTLLAEKGTAGLPEVSAVDVKSVTETTADYLDESYDGLEIQADISYSNAEATEFKTSVKCIIIKMQDVHYVNSSDVTSEREAGELADVWRVIEIA
jgi:sulfur relay (sulfurtransferase) DsrF/TusC family protein